MTRTSILSTLTILAFFLPLTAQSATFSTSDFGGNLQAAVDVASDGDTIVVDVPSTWALVNTRLVITGVPGGYIEDFVGLYMLAGATGSIVHSLDFQAPTGFTGAYAINGPGVDDVEIHNCVIDGFNTGIRGRFSDRWNVHHNLIVIKGSVHEYFWLNQAGIVLNAGVDAWKIHNNVIFAEQKGIYLFNGANNPTPIADIVIMHNEIVTSEAEAVGIYLASWVAAGRQVNIDIKSNDLIGTALPVLVWASAVIEDNRSEPGAYELDTSFAEGVIEGLIIRKND